MKKRIKIFILFISVIFIFGFSSVVFAEIYNPIDEEEAESIIFDSLNTYEKDETINNKKYESNNALNNSVLINACKVIINKPNIIKTGDTRQSSADIFGLNSAVLTYNKGSLNLLGGTIKTDGTYSNGIFAYKEGNVIVKDTNIRTKRKYSSGLMVTGKGNIDATNLDVFTEGSFSPAIRSYKGGGFISINKGKYITNGTSSPVIYSTGKTEVKNATLSSRESEGIIIDGPNSVTLNKVDFEDSNINVNDDSKIQKNIVLYRTINSNSTEPTLFKAINSNIKTNFGSTFFVTNTIGTIELENNKMTNNGNIFIRVQKSVWGTEGSNGGKATLKMTNQNAKGNVIVDKYSTLSMNLSNNSSYKGTIDGDNRAMALSLHIDKDSKIILTGDSYLSSLFNDDDTNSNIYLNGHKLIVNGKEVQGNNTVINKKSKKKEITKETKNTYFDSLKKAIPYLIDLGIFAAVVLLIMLFVFINNKRHNKMY